MLERITAFLERFPGTKARAVAAQLGLDRAHVSRLLHEHTDRFVQDTEFQWSCVESVCQIEFNGNGWLTAGDFERALRSLSPLDSPHPSVVFMLKDGGKPMLDFVARLLAFCNQLVLGGKDVTLDFDGSPSTVTYLNRAGFFGVLDPSIQVLPERPSGHLAKTYQGKNDGLIEFRRIDPTEPDQEIPSLLRKSFVSCAGDAYSQDAFTILSELFGNVTEHSESVAPGFAGLQFYGRAGKIQAVISDNGRGIVGTLMPVVPQKYPNVQRRIAPAPHAGIALLKEVFKAGGLSQSDDDGRGIGLQLSGHVASKSNAKISVRQSDFELRIHYNSDGIQFSHKTQLAHLQGTHICFEFKLDGRVKPA